MLAAISELTLVSHVPAVAVPPQIVAPTTTLTNRVATDILRVHTISPAFFRNHSAGGFQPPLQQAHEKQTVPARHLDRFG